MRTIIYAAVVFVALEACSSRANEKSTSVNDGAIPVKLIAINSDTSLTPIRASGLLSTENEAKLSFKVGGIIESIRVEEGDKVKRGDILATLKSTEIGAQVQQSELAAEKAQRDYQRIYNLYKDSVVTLEQLQNSKTGLDMARQSVQQARFNQEYSRIYAPSDGFITKKLANPGELASGGSAVLIMNALSSTSKWIITLGLADKEWAAIETGNKATVTIDAFTGKTFKAVVSKKAPAADVASGSFPVELQVDFGKEKPAIGMFGNASITPAHRSAGYYIPYEALLEANGNKGFVFVTDDKKTVKKIGVIISGIASNTVYISEGLKGYPYVVASGSPYLDDHSLITTDQ